MYFEFCVTQLPLSTTTPLSNYGLLLYLSSFEEELVQKVSLLHICYYYLHILLLKTILKCLEHKPFCPLKNLKNSVVFITPI